MAVAFVDKGAEGDNHSLEGMPEDLYPSAFAYDMVPIEEVFALGIDMYSVEGSNCTGREEACRKHSVLDVHLEKVWQEEPVKSQVDARSWLLVFS